MEMPKPGAEHKRLEKLAGTWKGTETMYPSPWDPNGGEAQGETRGRVALGGFVVIVDYEPSGDGNTTFEGHGVYTWDADAKEVILHGFDSTGQAREECRGGWDGDELTLAARNAMGHHRMTWDFSKPGSLDLFDGRLPGRIELVAALRRKLFSGRLMENEPACASGASPARLPHR